MPNLASAPASVLQSDLSGRTARARRRLGKAWRIGPAGWSDLLRAIGELARANRVVRRSSTRDLALLEGALATVPERTLTGPESRVVERVGFAIPAMGLRVPWRSDCLVQAVAARRWLADAGIGSVIAIGTRKDAAGQFEAHAWLKVGDTIVTGGDVTTYAEFEQTAPPA